MNFTDIYTEALLLANDFKAIHWHAAGSMFDFIHNKAEEFYEKASENADWFAEEAIKAGQKAFNPSEVKSYVDSEYTPVSVEAVDIQTFIYVSSTLGNKYLESLRGLFQSEPLESWQLSKIDEICEYWDTEINYKLEMMKLDSTDSEASEEDIEDSEIEDEPTESEEVEEESTEEDIAEEEPVEEDVSEDSDNPTNFDNIELSRKLDKDLAESIDMVENPLDRLLDAKSKFNTQQNYIW